MHAVEVEDRWVDGFSTDLGGLVFGRVEAFNSDLSEDVGLQRHLLQVAVINHSCWGRKNNT